MFAHLIYSAAFLTGALFAASPAAAAVPGKLQARDQRPVWSIAHKVLDTVGLEEAIYDQANAVEVDLTAWREGEGAETSQWWMDHDGDGKNYGNTADTLLRAVGDTAGDQISFVVFDIKTPDTCAVDEAGCGMETLVSMARDYVLANGIGVVYGFTNPGDAAGDAFKYVVENLDDDTAVRITGQTDPVLDAFKTHGADIPPEKRIIDYGNPYLGGEKGDPQFGKCESVPGGEVCSNLVRAIEARDNGELGTVMLWTVGSSAADGERTAQALDAGIDAVVYGYAFGEYEDSARTIEARMHVISWLGDHGDEARNAAQADRPWN